MSELSRAAIAETLPMTTDDLQAQCHSFRA
jgi:hypothetical protein